MRHAFLTLLLAAPFLLAVGGGAQPALAYAFLRSAQPAVGSTVATAPQRVAITFNEDVEPRSSAIDVRDVVGARVDKGDLHAGSAGNVLEIGLNPLQPGVYMVTWHVTSVDTRKTAGTYSFTVKP